MSATPLFRIGDSFLTEDKASGFLVAEIHNDRVRLDFLNTKKKWLSSNTTSVSQVNAVILGGDYPHQQYRVEKAMLCPECSTAYYAKEVFGLSEQFTVKTVCPECKAVAALDPEVLINRPLVGQTNKDNEVAMKKTIEVVEGQDSLKESGRMIIAQEEDSFGRFEPRIVQEQEAPLIGEQPIPPQEQAMEHAQETDDQKRLRIYGKLRVCPPAQIPPLVEELLAMPPAFKRTSDLSIRRAMGTYNEILKIVESRIITDNTGAIPMDLIEEIQGQLTKLKDQRDELNNLLLTISAESKAAPLIKTATTPAMTVVPNKFIHDLSRDIVNAKVSSGRNIEETFDGVVKKFALDDREQYMLIKNMGDMGYPIHRSPLLDFGPENYPG